MCSKEAGSHANRCGSRSCPKDFVERADAGFTNIAGADLCSQFCYRTALLWRAVFCGGRKTKHSRRQKAADNNTEAANVERPPDAKGIRAARKLFGTECQMLSIEGARFRAAERGIRP